MKYTQISSIIFWFLFFCVELPTREVYKNHKKMKNRKQIKKWASSTLFPTMKWYVCRYSYELYNLSGSMQFMRVMGAYSIEILLGEGWEESEKVGVGMDKQEPSILRAFAGLITRAMGTEYSGSNLLERCWCNEGTVKIWTNVGTKKMYESGWPLGKTW